MEQPDRLSVQQNFNQRHIAAAGGKNDSGGYMSLLQLAVLGRRRPTMCMARAYACEKIYEKANWGSVSEPQVRVSSKFIFCNLLAIGLYVRSRYIIP
jgi:hypothetical protein